jgi:hypothetical protein
MFAVGLQLCLLRIEVLHFVKVDDLQFSSLGVQVCLNQLTGRRWVLYPHLDTVIGYFLPAFNRENIPLISCILAVLIKLSVIYIVTKKYWHSHCSIIHLTEIKNDGVGK